MRHFTSDYICEHLKTERLCFIWLQLKSVITKEKLLSSIFNVEFEIMQIKGKPLSIYYIKFIK